ncbi:MAG: hypothetical protein HYV26_21860 [Candidatus Hydrogenedentes bacterium]|nr:hypothetical protein [Candidatus Hydrogenedentota bacterium]MBI3117934.1 hypothetical protein [Candidatus Hydrogenedentota bacterium]
MVIPVSDDRLGRNRTTRAAAIQQIEDAVSRAFRRGRAVYVTLEDAAAAERIFLRQCVQSAVLAGAARVHLAAAPATPAAAIAEMMQDIVYFTEGTVKVASVKAN